MVSACIMGTKPRSGDVMETPKPHWDLQKPSIEAEQRLTLGRHWDHPSAACAWAGSVVTSPRVGYAPPRIGWSPGDARGAGRLGNPPLRPSTPLTFRLRGSGSLSVPVLPLPSPSGLSGPEAKMAAAAAELVIGWCIFGLLLLVGEALRVLPGCGGGRRRAGQRRPGEPGDLPRPPCSLLGPRGSPRGRWGGADSRGLFPTSASHVLSVLSEDVAGWSVWGRATLGVEMALVGVRAASLLGAGLVTCLFF